MHDFRIRNCIPIIISNHLPGTRDLPNFQDYLEILESMGITISRGELQKLVTGMYMYQKTSNASAVEKSAPPAVDDKEMNQSEELWNFQNFAKIVAIVIDQETRAGTGR
jgi:hypothetical protein